MEIHHVGYLTKNLTITQNEFQNLGFIVEQEVTFDIYRKIYVAFLRNGPWRVELIEPQGESSPLYGLLKRYKNVPYHFCYITRNLKMEIVEWERRGYRVIQEPALAPCLEGGILVAFLINPDMGIIELAEIE